MASKKTKAKGSKARKPKPARKVAARKVAARKVAARKAAPRKTASRGASKRKSSATKDRVLKKTAPKPKRVVTAAQPKGQPKPQAKAKHTGRRAPTAKVAVHAAAALTEAPASKGPERRSTNTGPQTVVAVGTHRHPPAELPVDGDDSDSADPGLLSGPRDVQPYIAKRGEQYMSKQQLGHFSQILNQWKRDLMVEVDRTVSHMKDEAANFPDPNDRATQEEEFSLELRTRDRERKLIRKIDEALKRIDDGSYGYCLETGEEIGIKRLEARPVATLSIEAQERRERREKQYGDRDDRYR